MEKSQDDFRIFFILSLIQKSKAGLNAFDFWTKFPSALSLKFPSEKADTSGNVEKHRNMYSFIAVSLKFHHPFLNGNECKSY